MGCGMLSSESELFVLYYMIILEGVVEMYLDGSFKNFAKMGQ